MLRPVRFSKSFWQDTHLWVLGIEDNLKGSILSPQVVNFCQLTFLLLAKEEL